MTPKSVQPAAGSGLPGGFSPSQIRQAYGFNQITFGAVAGDGSGQTIAIVDAYDQPNIEADLATFDSTFGLPAPPNFRKVNQTGGASYPAADVNWGLEISLDVEWAHAMAPAANILLVEANSNSLSQLMTAVNYARNQPGVAVVSMSWGTGEWSWVNSYDSYFTTPAGHGGVTFVASSGDGGSAGAPSYPSISPNVLAVGGTQLSTDSLGNYLSETGWSGSGGGISAYQSQPAYQQGVVTQTSTLRTVPDVAYDGSGASAFAVYDTYSYSGWLQVYGTSAGAPQWAALVAIADQGLALAGQGALDGPSQTLPLLYQLPASAFRDVTSGSNGAYTASPGYDLVTGRGSPVANRVVAGLVGSSSGQPTNLPPMIITAASASPNPVTGSATNLSVQASDDDDASSLTYTWSVLGVPAGAAAPTFSVNGTNGAQNTTATFFQTGVYTIQVTVTDLGGLTATSSVGVTVGALLVDHPPVITTSASASASPVTGTTTTLSVQASDDAGEASLTYTWTVTSRPAGATDPICAFASGITNGTNGAKNATATFSSAGSYTFQVTITNLAGMTTTSSVSVTVNQTKTSIAISPSSASVPQGNGKQFTATALDQFGRALVSQPTFTWSVDTGGAGGIIDASSGFYTASILTGTDSVRATDASVGLSGTASILVTVAAAPKAPSNLAGAGTYNWSNPSLGAISLVWRDNATNETGYCVERSVNGTTWSVIASLPANSTCYLDTGLTAGAKYYYRVRAFNGPMPSSYTSSINVVATAATPAQPGSLTAKAVSSSQINLTWLDKAINETGYSVERSVNGTTWSVIASLAANSTSYSNTGLSGSTKYYYRVRSFDGPVLASRYTSTVNVTTPAGSPAPTSLTGGNGSSHGPHGAVDGHAKSDAVNGPASFDAAAFGALRPMSAGSPAVFDDFWLAVGASSAGFDFHNDGADDVPSHATLDDAFLAFRLKSGGSAAGLDFNNGVEADLT